MTDLQIRTDRDEVRDFVTRMGHFLDGLGGDPTEIYDRDVVVRSPRGEFRGYDEALAFITRERPTGEQTQHFHSDVLVDVQGDRATVTANQLVEFFQPRQVPHRTSGLRLTYTLVRRPSGWRLLEAEVELAWIVGALPTT